MVELNFDSTQVENVQTDFTPIPNGEYPAIVTNSEMKPTSNGKGHYLELTIQIIDGQYKNRNLWDRLNLDNPSDKAVQIAKAQLANLCRAVDVLRPNDSAELHNRPFLLKVAVEKRQDNGQNTNVVKGYRSINGQQQQGGIAPATTPAAPEQTTGGGAPWNK